MDIGGLKFLEMFEERFGRKATTILLAIIALGVASLMISLIWQYLVLPLYSFAGILVGSGLAPTGLQFAIPWETVVQVVLAIFLLIIVGCSVVSVTFFSVATTSITVAEIWNEFSSWRTKRARRKELQKKDNSAAS